MFLRHLLGTLVLMTSLMLGFSGLAIASEEGDKASEPTASEETQPPAKASPSDEASDQASDEATDEAAEDGGEPEK